MASNGFDLSDILPRVSDTYKESVKQYISTIPVTFDEKQEIEKAER